MGHSKALLKRFERSVKKNVKSDLLYEKRIKKLGNNVNQLVSQNDRLTKKLEELRKKTKTHTNAEHNKNVVTSAMVLALVSKNDRLTKKLAELEKKPCKIIRVENTQNIVTFIVLIAITYPFVRLSCYAATCHGVNMSEEANQFIATNVLGLQIMFVTVYYYMFNPYQEQQQ